MLCSRKRKKSYRNIELVVPLNYNLCTAYVIVTCLTFVSKLDHDIRFWARLKSSHAMSHAYLSSVQ